MNWRSWRARSIGPAGMARRMKFRSPALLHPESVAVPLLARTRGSVIKDMAELAAATHLLWDAGAMADAVRAREAMYSTALDNGVALLHPRRPMAAILAEAVLALGITPGGIPFGATAGARGQLTDIFFLICSTSDHEHLRILARLSRVISDADFLAALRAAPDAVAARELLVKREAGNSPIGRFLMHAATVTRPIVWLVGEVEHPDLADAVALLRETANVGPQPPELIVVAQSRPGAFPAPGIERLRRSATAGGCRRAVGQLVRGGNSQWPAGGGRHAVVLA